MSKITVEASALESIKAMCERLQQERDELLDFAKEYLDAWDSGMAGDSYLRRIAEKTIARTQE